MPYFIGISPIHPPELVKESGIPPELQYRECNSPQLSKPEKSPPKLVFTVVFADVAVGPTCQSAGVGTSELGYPLLLCQDLRSYL